MAYKNIEDQKRASKEHYDKNRTYYLNRNRRYRKELSHELNMIKEGMPCADCAVSYPYYVMDFDHLEGEEKLGLVSYFCKTGRINSMRAEIKKCELVCSNCHRARTYQRLQSVKNSII